MELPRKVLSSRVLTIPESKKVLEGEEELNQFQRKVLDYCIKHSKVDAERAKRLFEKLTSSLDVTPLEAAQIINIMPKSKEELRVIFYPRKKIVLESFLEEVWKVLTAEE
jgi:DNA-directed RNA polymerase subunit F